jgi:dTDP-4-amino-4,6-dideoxygalactose transaminase
MIPRFAPAASLTETLYFLADTVTGAGAGSQIVEQFEEEFAGWVGVRHARFVPSGRMGLYLLLRGLDYPAGSEIIVPAFTYFAIPTLLRLMGHTVVYADVEASTYELSAATVKPLITEKTRAVIPTHLFGRTCPLKGLQTLCDRHGIDIIEDCAQASGASMDLARAGSMGRGAYFTFGITKNFTTFSGGMVVTNDVEVDGRVSELLDQFGRPSRTRLLKEGATALAMLVATHRPVFSATLGPVLRYYPAADADPVHTAFEEAPRALTHNDLLAHQWRPDGAQAAAGLRQLRSIDARNDERRRRGNRLLQELRQRAVLGPPAPASRDGDHIFVSFAMRHPARRAFGAALRRRGIDFSPGYMSACSAMPALGGRPGLCPEAEAIEREIVHLPLYPGLSDKDIERIADGVAAAASEAMP